MIIFRKFNRSDWEAYSGCESEDPLIAEFMDRYVLIVDNRRVELIGSADFDVDEYTVVQSAEFPSHLAALDAATGLTESVECLDHRIWRRLMLAILPTKASLGDNR